MSRRLSHSQINKYSQCPRAYHYYYNEKLRETITSAALVFGSALDQTVNQILTDKKVGSLKSIIEYQTLFEKNWTNQKINNVFTYLPTSLDVAYADSDHDDDLLSDGDVRTLHTQALELIPNELNEVISIRENLSKAYGKLAAIKKVIGQENLPQGVLTYINLENWHVMLNKGKLMVTAYYSQVLPQIKEVVEVQKVVELNNEAGDTIIGYIDAVLDFGTGPSISDLKTSSIKYDSDSADVSPQLAVYGHALGITKTSFVVCSKAIRKNRTKKCAVCSHDGGATRAQTCNNGEGKARCGGEWIEAISPEAVIEIIHGNIDPVFEGHVLDNYEEILKAISAESYPRNWNSCYAYNRRCPYYSLCHEGKDNPNLVKVK